MRLIKFCVAVVVSTFFLAACESDTSDGTGSLTLGLTDGPVESANAVVVRFTGFELKRAGDKAPLDPIVFSEDSCNIEWDAATGTCSIDLLQLTGETRKVVFNGEIPAGKYEWVRLMVDADLNEMDSYIELDDGSMCSLWVPSGDETGLKIVSGITVTANGVSDYTLDFDVKSSITAPPGLAYPSAEACAQNYILKPAIRIVDTTQTGTLSGTVATSLLESEASCEVATEGANAGLYDNVAVYLFENFDGNAVADDIDQEGDNANPITTANVEYDGAAYGYEVGYLLAPEDYLVALTCTAGVDEANLDEFDPSSSDQQSFSFIAEQDVTTVIGAPVDVSF
jgi:hypothetical protein